MEGLELANRFFDSLHRYLSDGLTDSLRCRSGKTSFRVSPIILWPISGFFSGGFN